jgi:hypothetical protein
MTRISQGIAISSAAVQPSLDAMNIMFRVTPETWRFTSNMLQWKLYLFPFWKWAKGNRYRFVAT